MLNQQEEKGGLHSNPNQEREVGLTHNKQNKSSSKLQLRAITPF